MGIDKEFQVPEKKEIQVLDQNTIDKIAAGEVVERPASVIKELMENAIDAKATAVTVEIKDGGITFMRITDNGEGIAADQMQTAFLSHATSKIRKVEDLEQIASLGFRGEALSSIAAVAQVECISKVPNAITGVRYCIDGGIEQSYEEIGAPEGTTFVIRNLFYNTPARRKFLKSATAEGNQISNIVEEMALSHPEISVKFIQNGQNKLFTNGNGNLTEVIYQVFGRDTTKQLLPIDVTTETCRIKGFIGNPASARGNRNFENYFVNGRYVKNASIAKAIEDGYHGFLMQHRYPFTLLYIEVNGDVVDVNVHPRKMEIRFSDQEAIYREVYLAVKNALMIRERIPEVSVEKESVIAAQRRKEMATQHEQSPKSYPEPFERARIQNQKASLLRENTGYTAVPIPEIPEKPEYFEKPEKSGKPEIVEKPEKSEKPEITEKPENTEQPKTPAKNEGVQSPELTADSKVALNIGMMTQNTPLSNVEVSRKPEQMQMFSDKVLSTKNRKQFKLIGQLFETYWLIEFSDSLYIIDQHAAHEKILYERMMKAYQNKTIHSQTLFPSWVIHLSKREVSLVQEHLEAFTSLGFELEPFGGDAWKVTAVPSNLYSISDETLFQDILADLDEPGVLATKSIPEKLASMSCKAAVKGNHKLSVAEAERLIDELLTLENPYNCPHGRPTIISMSRYELDKKFKRIVG